MNKGMLSTGVFFYSLSIFMFFVYFRNMKVITIYTSSYEGYKSYINTITSNVLTFDGLTGVLAFLFLFIATIFTICGINSTSKKEKELKLKSKED